MQKVLLALITIFSFALQASALDVKSITARPTAGRPQYGDEKVWPMLVGDEYFQKRETALGGIGAGACRMCSYLHGSCSPSSRRADWPELRSASGRSAVCRRGL